MLTLGEVAAASSGRSPPHAVTRLSASWEIMWVTFTTNTWFSDAFTKSITVFVLWLQEERFVKHLIMPDYSLRYNIEGKKRIFICIENHCIPVESMDRNSETLNKSTQQNLNMQ